MKTIKNISFISFCLLLVVTSCKVGDAYERPDFDIDDTYYGAETMQDSSKTDSIVLAKMKWVEFFKGYDLVSLINTALDNNLDMQKAVQTIEMSAQDLKQSKAAFYPTLGVTPFGYERGYYSENYNNYGSNRARRNHGENPPTSLYTERLAHTVGAQASWELGLWGKYRWQKDAARATFMQTQEFKKAVQTALVAEVATTYYTLLRLKAELEVAQSNLELNENTLRIVELQYEAGEATSLAIQQTKSQKLKFEALIPQIERRYTIQENKLNHLLGRTPQSIDIEGLWGYPEFYTNLTTGVPLELITNRPDVAAAEYALIASNAQVGIAHTMKYPSITINAGMGLDSYKLNSLFNPMESAFALLNGALFQPIFQNGKLKANHKKAIAAREIAQLEFKDKFITAIKEVSNALVSIEKLEEELVLAKARLETTQKGVRDAALLFKSGFATYLEVITAQSDALESELNLIDINMRLYMGHIELYRSLGGGWQ